MRRDERFTVSLGRARPRLSRRGWRFGGMTRRRWRHDLGNRRRRHLRRQGLRLARRRRRRRHGIAGRHRSVAHDVLLRTLKWPRDRNARRLRRAFPLRDHGPRPLAAHASVVLGAVLALVRILATGLLRGLLALVLLVLLLALLLLALLLRRVLVVLLVHGLSSSPRSLATADMAAT